MWAKNAPTLYPYQEDAANTMALSNVLLAYDMGTGKTPTTLAAIEKMRQQGEIRKWGTVLVPSSLKYQWQREILRFTDQVAMVVDGPPAKRAQMYRDLELTYPGYLIMSYDTWVRDIDVMLPGPEMANGFMVLDEATAIKNFTAKRTKVLKKYRKHYPVRLALTGTPIENGKLEEIYSILEWVDPEILPRWHSFENRYIVRNGLGWIEGYKNVGDFHKKIKPYVLRKTVDDPDVAGFMPKVVHYPPHYVRLDKKTYHVYESIQAEVQETLDKLAEGLSKMGESSWWKARPWQETDDDDHPDGELMARIQAMRMLLDHPLAVLNSAARHDDPTDDRGSRFAARIVSDGTMAGIVHSPKLDALVEYLKDFFDVNDPKSKVVVFCSFIDVAEKIHESLPWESVLFTGDLNARQRDEVKQQFVSDPNVKVFVSTDAGGYGLDLPVANLLINYDQPWQAGLLKQRNARIRRASSEWKHVFIQDFVVADTIEERMEETLRHKNAVATGAIDGEGLVDGELPSTLGSLRSFLQDLTER